MYTIFSHDTKQYPQGAVLFRNRVTATSVARFYDISIKCTNDPDTRVFYANKTQIGAIDCKPHDGKYFASAHNKARTFDSFALALKFALSDIQPKYKDFIRATA